MSKRRPLEKGDRVRIYTSDGDVGTVVRCNRRVAGHRAYEVLLDIDADKPNAKKQWTGAYLRSELRALPRRKRESINCICNDEQCDGRCTRRKKR